MILGVDLAERGLFDQTVEILDGTHARLRRHPLAEEAAPVLPGFLANLGLARILCGGFGAAEDHLEEARSLARERNLDLLELVTRQNLGCLTLRRGDPAGAIAVFTDLAHRLPADRREALCTDLAEALLAEGRLEEAALTLADGPWAHGRSAQPVTLLVEAKLRLLRGDRYRARELVRRVQDAHGPGSLWFRLAVRVEAMADRVCAAPLERLYTSPQERAHAALELRRPLSVSRPVPRLVAAHRAVDVRLPPWPPAPRMPGGPRVVHGSHPARTPRATGGPRTAHGRQETSGPRVTHESQEIGDPWAACAGPAGGDPHVAGDPQVVRAGVEVALARGDLRGALEWAEFSVPPEPRVPAGRCDPVVERYREALANGRDRHCLVYARRWERARYARGVPDRECGPVGARLSGLLADRAFVRLVVVGEVVALVVVDGRVHARSLGPPARVARGVAAALAPVLALVRDRPLVIAADPRLGHPPWGALPGLRGRPVAVVPSARSWVDRAARPLPHWRRVLLASGPTPRGAAREVADLGGVHSGARRAARVHEVAAGAAGCDLVHLSGHGRVAERSPLLSSVALADGPLLALDLVSAAPPEVVVLTSCGAGRFAGALLAAGVRAVVASPAPVRDAGTGRAVAGFHRALAAGAAPPEAVAAHLGRHGFVCLGA
ncbi:CHAT domain-containing protein [Nocardiopsis sp. CC223A]|uniref:CHAT domain-containing protein n=1 Tax=Nocardiopsis sp. CC223A TaxID=3044051 RepID=UPI00278C7AC1|nr:CHAT domain-containing protein [Nocardiopsis sp. CC223A]